jgi:hypothetical protein
MPRPRSGSRAELSRVAEAGTGIDLSQLVPIPGRVPGPVPEMVSGQPEGSFLLPGVESDDSWWVTEPR